MAPAHIVELPTSVFVLKIVQLVISVLVLGLDGYLISQTIGVSVDEAFTIFVCAFSMLITIYYIVATKGATGMYNWIVLLVVECLAVIFWLSQWSALTAGLVVIEDSETCNGFECESTSDYIASSIGLTTFFAIVKVVIILGAINFVLFCVTLGFMGTGIHRHRTAGKPITSNGNYSPASRGVPDLEENKMHTMPSAPAYPNDVQYAPRQAPTQPAYNSPQAYCSPAPGYAQPAMAQPPAPEVYGSRPY